MWEYAGFQILQNSLTVIIIVNPLLIYSETYFLSCTFGWTMILPDKSLHGSCTGVAIHRIDSPPLSTDQQDRKRNLFPINKDDHVWESWFCFLALLGNLRSKLKQVQVGTFHFIFFHYGVTLKISNVITAQSYVCVFRSKSHWDWRQTPVCRESGTASFTLDGHTCSLFCIVGPGQTGFSGFKTMPEPAEAF